MKKKAYFENLNYAIIQNNKKALAYGDGLAWDNKKKKTMKSHMPRGKAYIRLEAINWSKIFSEMKRVNDIYSNRA